MCGALAHTKADVEHSMRRPCIHEVIRSSRLRYSVEVGITRHNLTCTSCAPMLHLHLLHSDAKDHRCPPMPSTPP